MKGTFKQKNIDIAVQTTDRQHTVTKRLSVKKGQAIARLRLVPSPTALNNAKANVELSKIRLAEAKRQLEQQKNINLQKFDLQQAETEFENAQIQEKKYKKGKLMSLAALAAGAIAGIIIGVICCCCCISVICYYTFRNKR